MFENFGIDPTMLTFTTRPVKGELFLLGSMAGPLVSDGLVAMPAGRYLAGTGLTPVTYVQHENARDSVSEGAVVWEIFETSRQMVVWIAPTQAMAEQSIRLVTGTIAAQFAAARDDELEEEGARLV